MNRVELILCWEDNTWSDGFYIDLEDDIFARGDVDEIAQKFLEQEKDNRELVESIVHISVYNWNVDKEESNEQVSEVFRIRASEARKDAGDE